MTRAEYAGLQEAQIDISQLSSVLGLLSRAAEDGEITDAFASCAVAAHDIARRIDDIPGFLDAQTRT